MSFAKHPCCVMACNADARWILIDGPTVDDYTYACDDHVGHLCDDTKDTVVSPIDAEPPAYPFVGNPSGKASAP